MFVVSVRERGKEEHKFTFRKEKVVVGRLRANDIILPKRNISKKHATMEVVNGQVVIEDAGSTNGSYINGKKVVGRTNVGPDDKIFMGDYIIQIELAEDKSAIDSSGLATEFSPLARTEGGDSGAKATVSDLDLGIMDTDLRRNGVDLEADVRSGPSTVVVDPMSVPKAPPPDLELEGFELDHALGPMAEDETVQARAPEEEQDTLRFRKASSAPAETGGADEELLDIPLMDEVEQLSADLAAGRAEPPPERTPLPVSQPTPAPPPAPLVEPPKRVVPMSRPGAQPPQAVVPPPRPAPTPVEPPRPQPVEAPRPQPVAPPPPQPKSAPVDVKAFAPSVSRLEGSLTTSLNANYRKLAQDFDTWLESVRGKPTQAEALKKTKEILLGFLTDKISGAELDQVATKVLAELSYLGAAAELLEDPRVGEVFVASSGQILAYDWRGGLVTTGAALSCPAAVSRVAAKIQKSATRKEKGFGQGVLANGTVVRVLCYPIASGEPCIRFTRPYQTSMSIGKLQETGIMSAPQAEVLKAAIAARRSILVVGCESSTNAIVLHSLVESLPSHCKILAAGDRFCAGTALENRTLFDPATLPIPEFLESVAAMDFHWIAMEGATGDQVSAVIRLGGTLQLPFLVSARLNNPSEVTSLLRAKDAESREALLHILHDARTLVLNTGPASNACNRVEALSLFTMESGAPRLVPASF